MLTMLRVVLATLVLAVCTAVRYEGYHVISVDVRTEQELALIRTVTDRYRQVIVIHEPGDLLVPPNLVAMATDALEARGLSFAIVETDLEAHHQRVMKQNVLNKAKNFQQMGQGPAYSYDYYMEIDEMFTYVRSLVDTSSIATLKTMPLASYEGNPMYYVAINEDKPGLPALWIEAGIHCREWITMPTVIYLLEQILHGSSSEDANFRNNYRWFIAPNVNPDGYIFTWSDDRMWRKTLSPNAGSSCAGTDANRNFGYEWGGPGASTDPCHETYRGSEAFSEVETQAIRDTITSYIDGLISYISVHSYAQMWLHPWAYNDDPPPPHRANMSEAGNVAVAAIEAVHGKPFDVGSPAELLGVASGGAFDWAYGEMGIIYSYSPELRPRTAIEGGFDPDPSNILPSGQEFYAGIVALVDHICPPVGRGKRGRLFPC